MPLHNPKAPHIVTFRALQELTEQVNNFDYTQSVKHFYNKNKSKIIKLSKKYPTEEETISVMLFILGNIKVFKQNYITYGHI